MAGVTSIAHVITNQRSGAGDKSILNAEIEAAFKAHDWRVEFIVVDRDTLRMRAQQAVAQAPGTIVVAGGDGTINTVASECVKANRPLGILPAGTFNYIARNLRLPTEVPHAVEVIVSGRPRPLDIGEINGRIFLNNAGFGLYSNLVEQREIDKRRFGRSRLVAVFSGIRCLLGSQPLFSLDLTAEGRRERLLTTTLFFGCNALQLETFNASAADCLRQGKLAVLSLRLHSRWDIAVAVLAALAGKLDRARNTDAFCAGSVRVHTRRRALKVALDGEIIVTRPPLDVRLLCGGLQVFAPEQRDS
jgi:diacylglycerol kinase family enzyme